MKNSINSFPINDSQYLNLYKYVCTCLSTQLVEAISAKALLQLYFPTHISANRSEPRASKTIEVHIWIGIAPVLIIITAGQREFWGSIAS